MTRSKGAAVLIVAIALVFAGAVSIASSRGGPLDLGISKDKDGPFAKRIQDPDPADGNTQLKTQNVKDGESVKFFIRLKNPSVSDDGVYIEADTGGMDYDVKYTLDGQNVTNDIASPDCDQFLLDGGEKVIFTMKIKPTGADPGDQAFFSMSTVESLCDDIADRVYGKVKVTAP